LGAAFHPELTGRENIFLNAAVLGMGRAEILRKFDEIVAFAGFSDRLDQPVKHYSSGCTCGWPSRVASHVDPEILLMDEVLAVGDVDFQKKSMDRLEQVGRNGQTVVFVSHNVHAVLRLCNRAVLLDQGRVLASGAVRDVVSTYLALFGASGGDRCYPDEVGQPGDAVVRMQQIRVISATSETLADVNLDEAFGIEMRFRVLVPGMTLFPSLTVNNEWGPICWVTDAATDGHGAIRPCGEYCGHGMVSSQLPLGRQDDCDRSDALLRALYRSLRRARCSELPGNRDQWRKPRSLSGKYRWGRATVTALASGLSALIGAWRKPYSESQCKSAAKSIDTVAPSIFRRELFPHFDLRLTGPFIDNAFKQRKRLLVGIVRSD